MVFLATHRSRAPMCALVALTLASGCSDITRVQDPPVITPADLHNAAGAMSLRAGALNNLFGAFSGQALYSGLFVDEFMASSLQQATSLPEDQRVLTVANAGNYPLGGLAGGRINAEIAIAGLKQFSPKPPSYIGELYALVATSEIEVAEDVCSGVPFAIVNGYTPSYGPTLSRQQVVRQAFVDLDSAAAYSNTSDSLANLVAVLRGRAWSDSGDLAAAAVAVQNVPLEFAYTAELSDTNNPNAIYQQIVSNGLITVSDREGINGLPFVSANDPRVPTVALQPLGTTVYAPAAVSSGSAPLTLASGIEAQLLQAEAALSAGQVGMWTNILNTLRQNGISPAMAPLTSDSTTGASPSLQLAVMFRERAFWLFATGHREGDIRRLVRQYGLPISAVYPTGPYFGGPSNYGSSVVIPVGGEEGFNPGYHGCLNTSP